MPEISWITGIYFIYNTLTADAYPHHSTRLHFVKKPPAREGREVKGGSLIQQLQACQRMAIKQCGAIWPVVRFFRSAPLFARYNLSVTSFQIRRSCMTSSAGVLLISDAFGEDPQKHPVNYTGSEGVYFPSIARYRKVTT